MYQVCAAIGPSRLSGWLRLVARKRPSSGTSSNEFTSGLPGSAVLMAMWPAVNTRSPLRTACE